MSNSRPSRTGTIPLAGSTSSPSGVPTAGGATSRSGPAFLVGRNGAATRLMRPASATDELPYFCTTRHAASTFRYAGGARRIPGLQNLHDRSAPGSAEALTDRKDSGDRHDRPDFARPQD